MPLRKGFCHCTSVNNTLMARLQLNYFLVTKAITHWNQIQVRIIDTLEVVFFSCSCKSQGRIKGIECSFRINYHWDSMKKSFVFSYRSSNLSHNHQLFPQVTVVDGCVIVSLENLLTHEEFQSIEEQSFKSSFNPVTTKFAQTFVTSFPLRRYGRCNSI